MKTIIYALGASSISALIAAGPVAAQTTPSDTLTTNERTATGVTTQGKTAFLGMSDVRASRLIGARVYNARNEVIGDINELLIGSNGAIERIVVGVGGFLGVGERNVALQLSDLTFGRDGTDFKISSRMTKEQLKAMPEWKAPQT